ncbi:MAG: hypothetical protein A2498_02715 [Lentisphaerae bacterium RIFOXYC12_FULL_60_16]|nr:MAG: hypothetical protein A2498_02715 [Lentisphaerae bacterium RIFOXYC12_FULL_60_16]OGV75119.1 MAG: hypothetical protein A2269_00795 [Lentisphaerae bacterium RIFOXYA12_FULL_60_10]OGV77442.1 MAG: hypothetical protein A2340_06730 [Lentisphaerae bacterium RIFOXYB12_FULL_60_10]
MGQYDIGSALVYDRAAHEAGVFDRFDFILEACGTSHRLLPTIPVLPPATREQMPPADLVAFCLDHGIKAVRACPTAHNFICDRHSMGRLCTQLQARRMPLIHSSIGLREHPYKHQPPWHDLRDLALAFPDMPVIVLHTGMMQGRNLFTLLEECPNVMADLSCASFQYVEEVVAHFGSARLVMASHFPAEDPGLYTTWLNYAKVDADVRANIAGDNLRRLLAAVV